MSTFSVGKIFGARHAQVLFAAGILSGLALCMTIMPPKAFAECATATDGPGVIADSTCDCDYWNSLESHAWLTAEREVVQNQNLIVKADSVLEYTCFDNFLAVTAGVYIAGLFSETDYWGFPPGRNARSTDEALTGGVYISLLAYLTSNFPHTFLGGRTSMDHSTRPPDGRNYYCSNLARVWQLAKCYNFATENHDGWFSFENYATTDDKRRLPNPCSRDGRWQTQLDRALEDTRPWWIDQNPINEDVFQNVSDYLDPGNCQDPQPTGVVIDSYLRAMNWDAFCTNPGCDYNGTGCSAN
ncbi:MAG: hypothetical protein EOM26_10190 [Alphaproteobacteria bacterium]|nr:hypothetical protein [Alphaproteobacteria bacterium]